MEIESMSASRIKTFLRCPRQFYFRYCERLIIPPSAALTVGSSFHSSIGKNYSQKIVSREDMKVGDVLDLFSTEFDERSHGTIWREDEDKGKIKDTAILTLEHYQGQIAPVTQPVAVEKEFFLKMKKGNETADWQFHGFVDLVDEKEVIVETKTSSRKPKEPSPDDILQTSAYAAGARVEGTNKNNLVRIDYAIKKKVPEVVSFSRQVSDDEIRFLLNVMNSVVAAIEAEIWIPQRGAYTCSRRWCGYANICEQKIGGRVRD